MTTSSATERPCSPSRGCSRTTAQRASPRAKTKPRSVPTSTPMRSCSVVVSIAVTIRTPNDRAPCRRLVPEVSAHDYQPDPEGGPALCVGCGETVYSARLGHCPGLGPLRARVAALREIVELRRELAALSAERESPR